MNITLEKIDAEFPGALADTADRLRRQSDEFIKRHREKSKESHKQWFYAIHREHVRNESAKAMAANTESGSQNKVEVLRNGFYSLLKRFQDGEIKESDVLTAETLVVMEIRKIARAKHEII